MWETVNALAAKPGMLNMGQGFPDYPPSPVAREVSAAAISSGESAMNQSVSRRCAMLLAYVALRCVLPALLFGTDPPRVESQTEPLPTVWCARDHPRRQVLPAAGAARAEGVRRGVLL